MHEEVEHALVELARGDGVQHDDAQHLARAGGHGDGDHRLEVLLLELGHVLHARVRERVLADERGLAGPCDPARQPLVEGELDLAHHVGVDARRGPDPQAVAIAQVDEAGMAARRLGDELDDAVEHPGQVDRRADGADDRVQRVALEPYALELCRQVAAAGGHAIDPTGRMYPRYMSWAEMVASSRHCPVRAPLDRTIATPRWRGIGGCREGTGCCRSSSPRSSRSTKRHPRSR